MSKLTAVSVYNTTKSATTVAGVGPFSSISIYNGISQAILVSGAEDLIRVRLLHWAHTDVFFNNTTIFFNDNA